MTSRLDSTLDALLADLEQRNIKLRVDGDRLRFTAPQGAVTPEVRELLAARKAELIDFLRSRGARTHPPSFVQRRFWTLQRLNPDQAFYNVPFAFRLQGPLDVDTLRKSFDAVVQRHESLRTTLREIDGQLTQVIAPAGEVNLAVADARADEVNQLLQSGMERQFDLAREVGLRVLLLRIDVEEHLLQLCFHNTLFDQSSLIVLLDELSLHYAAFLKGERVDLPQPAQYSEYVRWHDSFTSSGEDARLNYWRQWFHVGEPPPWSWKPAKPAPAARSFHSHVNWMRLTPESTQDLKAFCQRNGVTPYLALLTAYAMILTRYTGALDLTLGTTYSNRNHWSLATLIGATIDVPALRFDMTDDPDFLTLLGRVRSVVAEALTHQDVPLERMLPSLQMTRKQSGPLFRMVMSYFAETPHDRLKLPGIEVTFLEESINELSRPDLYLVFWEQRDTLTGYWMHKQDVFAPETAQRMNREFYTLLEVIVKQPATRISALVGQAILLPAILEHGRQV